MRASSFSAVWPILLGSCGTCAQTGLGVEGGRAQLARYEREILAEVQAWQRADDLARPDGFMYAVVIGTKINLVAAASPTTM